MSEFLKRTIVSLALSCVMVSAASAQMVNLSPPPPKRMQWATYYGSGLSPQKLQKYSLLVLDRDAHPSLESLVNENRTLLGYISAGEAEDYRPDFAEIKRLGVLLEENKAWKGHYIIDIRNPEWTRYIIEEAIPSSIHRHFNGVMLDTLDSVIDLENRDPKKYGGMKAAAVRMIYAIRLHYPTIKIMVNRGFDIMPQVATQIDYLMAESVYSIQDPKTKKFIRVPEPTYQELVGHLKDLKKNTPKLQIVSLDYWDLKDAAGVKKIYALQRENGFLPYVSSPDLQQLPDEPK